MEASEKKQANCLSLAPDLSNCLPSRGGLLKEDSADGCSCWTEHISSSNHQQLGDALLTFRTNQSELTKEQRDAFIFSGSNFRHSVKNRILQNGLASFLIAQGQMENGILKLTSKLCVKAELGSRPLIVAFLLRQTPVNNTKADPLEA